MCLLLKLTIIISIFKEDNVFGMNANLPYGPSLNTYIIFLRFLLVI